jgi:hypothetical protein
LSFKPHNHLVLWEKLNILAKRSNLKLQNTHIINVLTAREGIERSLLYLAGGTFLVGVEPLQGALTPTNL